MTQCGCSNCEPVWWEFEPCSSDIDEGVLYISNEYSEYHRVDADYWIESCPFGVGGADEVEDKDQLAYIEGLFQEWLAERAGKVEGIEG